MAQVLNGFGRVCHPNLPSITAARSAALRVRLRCCAPLAAWELSEELAALLRGGGESELEIVAGFLCRRAVREAKEGLISAAGESIRQALGHSPSNMRQ